jgi:hypothetical protein
MVCNGVEASLKGEVGDGGGGDNDELTWQNWIVRKCSFWPT